MEFFKKVSSQIADFLQSLSPGKRLGLAGAFVGILAAMVGLVMWAGDKSYIPLMSNLSPEDSANIIRVLRDKHIPFKVDPSGRNVSVPPESMLNLRLELATMGYPQSSVVGYEIFDHQNLGVTSFVQKVNQKRALEGELMRTINTIKGVKRSRVHLALPQKSAFVEDQKKPTASVVLDLEPGMQLGERQVYGVGNLVARAIEGMDVPDVVIMDSNGKVLSKNNSDPLSAATASQIDFQRKIETDYEHAIESMLSRVVGDGKVVAKVTADVDFAQVSETQTMYDSDGSAVRTVDKRNDSMTGTRPAPGGAAGAVSNTPGANPNGSAELKNTTTKDNEVTSYEIPQTVRKTIKPSGGIKKISVAVVVDGKMTHITDKDGKVQTKVDPWPEEKIKEFKDIVAGAVALDLKRGDTIEIKNLEFTRVDFDDAQKALADAEYKSYLRHMIVYTLIGIIILAFFFFVVRPFVKWLTENTIDSVDTFLPQTIEELERMQKNSALPGMEEVIPVLPDKVDPEKVEGDMIKEKINTLVDTNPHKAALILRDWLHSKKANAGEEAGGDGKDKGKTA